MSQPYRRNPLKPPMQWRWWHKWLGIVLSLPLLLVAVTAILLAHDRALGLRQISVVADWLPAYGDAATGIEIRAAQRLLDTDYMATRQGLFALRDGQVETIAALRGTEMRDLAIADGRLYGAARNGIWLRDADGTWRHVLKAEAWSVNVRPDGAILAATRERGLAVSMDGGIQWESENAAARAIAEQSGIDPRATNLGRLVLDLHTGKAILGRQLEWLWIDITGAALVFLAVSGLVMWLRARRQRLQARYERLRRERQMPVAARHQ
ncbi:PepSY-associated TM helix domain-containing protein [Ferrovibrio sp.]|uniref:PepSY-associated TM helix domain-containing protein n=1 Tax=Ferrovibrio sp. TaxID=1917215 RepID=UPI0035B06342